jgi:hypothetical protein
VIIIMAEAEMFPGRTTRSPLVLVGAIATAGMLVGGLVAFKKVCAPRQLHRDTRALCAFPH